MRRRPAFDWKKAARRYAKGVAIGLAAAFAVPGTLPPWQEVLRGAIYGLLGAAIADHDAFRDEGDDRGVRG